MSCRGRASRPICWRATRAIGSSRRARPGTASAGSKPGFAITDPAKLTLLTPGFDRRTGAYEAHGVPAPVVAQYLRENRVVPEKNDLNSLLFLLTPGVESSKAGTLVSSLVAFKRLHDDNALLDDADAGIRRAAAGALSRQAVARPLRRDARLLPRRATSARLQRAQFQAEHLPEMVMTPRAASRHLVRNNVDYVPLDALEGRIATTLFVVYPPGIATIVPGERLGPRARPMIDYLKTFERAANLFPGFEAEIQGLYREVDERGRDPLPHLRCKGVSPSPLAKQRVLRHLARR